jgi:hypothetical protein
MNLQLSATCFDLFRAIFRLKLRGYIHIYCNAVKYEISFAIRSCENMKYNVHLPRFNLKMALKSRNM